MKQAKTWLLVAISCLAAASALAADYSGYSTEDLATMRGTMQNVTIEEQNAFRSEWQKRLKTMSLQERRQYAERPTNAPQNSADYSEYGK
ncbi:MAG: DUF1104 domain-containing protein [Dissulfurimicrobium sp.]|uniref:DUF1104 domain-containing protein n=1 Tax=Dissulfurimicrobium sp. TaxID=2022436 RepID=UPI00404B7D8F